VYGARHQLFAGAAFTRDQHDRVGRRDLHDARQHVADRLRATHDVGEVIALLELLREELHLPVQAPALERLRHLDDQFLLGERLLDVVEGAETHGFDRALDGAVRRHHDDLGHRLRFLDRTEHLDAVVLTHAQIGDDDVVGARAAHLSPLRAVSRLVDLVAAASQHHGERGAHVALVVDDENFSHVRQSFSRRITLSSIPRIDESKIAHLWPVLGCCMAVALPSERLAHSGSPVPWNGPPRSCRKAARGHDTGDPISWMRFSATASARGRRNCANVGHGCLRRFLLGRHCNCVAV
jgi:hypothetical protein